MFHSPRSLRASVLPALISLFLTQLAGAADLGAEYEWKPMKIGGGGWLVGMSINPAEKGVMYARTDVSGAYRWNPDTGSWKQVVTSKSLPAGYFGYGKFCGVDSIVGAPSEANVAYMALADQPYKKVPGQIFRSVDRGDTWVATKFKDAGVKVEANGEGRQDGERLSVDPVNSKVVYFASIEDGLWMTENGGDAWAKVGAIPQGKAPHGVTTFVFDRSGSAVASPDGSQKTKVAYASVEEGGVFRTEDAGASWKKISDGGAGDAGKPRDATIGSDGTYYVAYDSEKGSTGAVRKYSAANGWTDITPQDKRGGKDKRYWAVAADPFDPQHVVAMIHGGWTFDSVDQGATWTSHSFALKSEKVDWLGKQTNYFLSTGQLAFDAHEKGKLWFAEGFGVWWAQDLTTPAIAWHSASEGIEEVCGNDVIAPPGGKPVGAMFDTGVFYFGDVDSYTATRAQPTFMSAWALDWCASDPKFLVAVFRSHLDFVPKAKSSGYSTDGGKTWTRFPAIDQGTLPADLDYGVIAVATGHPDHIVWCPIGGKLPYYTADRGVTWKHCDFGGPRQAGNQSPYSPLKPLCADRVDADTFYFYTPQEGVFRSTDGGATFAKAGSPAPNRWNAILKATPGHAGDLWFSAGPGMGLYHSADAGVTWAKIPGVDVAQNVGIGKAKAEGYPTLFVAGNVAGKTGIHRSTDQGVTWDKIVDYPLGIFDAIDAMEGDKDTFGRVYVCFSGTGFAYGTPKAAKAAPGD